MICGPRARSRRGMVRDAPAATGRGHRSGATAERIAASLGGMASCHERPGKFIGVDLAEALRRFERQRLKRHADGCARDARRSERPSESSWSRAAQILTASLTALSFRACWKRSSPRDGASTKGRRREHEPVGERTLISVSHSASRVPLTEVQLVPSQGLDRARGARDCSLARSVVAPAAIEGEPPGRSSRAQQQ